MSLPPPLVVVPVLLAGGSGTRLWPLSRALHPKQYIALGLGTSASSAAADGKEPTLFQQAARRLAELADASIDVMPACIVANEEHRFTVVDQLAGTGLEQSSVLLEPFGRNTAPALTLAVLESKRRAGPDVDPVLVVSPADHAIADASACTSALRHAIAAAKVGGIVVLGVRPTRPDTGYGYIHTHPSSENEAGARSVDKFVEKPARETAERYVAEGDYWWNSGMFVLRASVWVDALRRFRPDIESASDHASRTAAIDAAFVRYDKASFAAIPADSIDYAVMEPAAASGSGIAVKMVVLDAGWNDLGAWSSVWQASTRDLQGNATHGDTLVHDSRNTLVHATSRLVGVIGLDDITVVETPDAVLVAHRSQSPAVKDLVSALVDGHRAEATTHRRVHRPWGWYESVDSGPRFQVKRIMVKPGGRLSLQMHHHRAEHWVVVSGTAEVTNGDNVVVLSENQSTYIPLGQKHRLANPGKVPLEVVEVQSGSYLGEDDIMRFEDHYGRP